MKEETPINQTSEIISHQNSTNNITSPNKFEDLKFLDIQNFREMAKQYLTQNSPSENKIKQGINTTPNENKGHIYSAALKIAKFKDNRSNSPTIRTTPIVKLKGVLGVGTPVGQGMKTGPGPKQTSARFIGNRDMTSSPFKNNPECSPGRANIHPAVRFHNGLEGKQKKISNLKVAAKKIQISGGRHKKSESASEILTSGYKNIDSILDKTKKDFNGSDFVKSHLENYNFGYAQETYNNTESPRNNYIIKSASEEHKAPKPGGRRATCVTPQSIGNSNITSNFFNFPSPNDIPQKPTSKIAQNIQITPRQNTRNIGNGGNIGNQGNNGNISNISNISNVAKSPIPNKPSDELQELLNRAQKEIWNNSSHNPLAEVGKRGLQVWMKGAKFIPSTKGSVLATLRNHNKSEILTSDSFTHQNIYIQSEDQNPNQSVLLPGENVDKLRADILKWRQFGYLLAESFDKVKQEQKVLLGERNKDLKIIGELQQENIRVKKLMTNSNAENEKLRDELGSEQKTRENILEMKETIETQTSNISQLRGEKEKYEKLMSGMRVEKESLVSEKEITSKMITQLNMKIKTLKNEINQNQEKNTNISQPNTPNREIEYYKRISEQHLQECRTLAEQLICMRSDLDRSHSDYLKIQRHNSNSMDSMGQRCASAINASTASGHESSASMVRIGGVGLGVSKVLGTPRQPLGDGGSKGGGVGVQGNFSGRRDAEINRNYRDCYVSGDANIITPQNALIPTPNSSSTYNFSTHRVSSPLNNMEYDSVGVKQGLNTKVTSYKHVGKP